MKQSNKVVQQKTCYFNIFLVFKPQLFKRLLDGAVKFKWTPANLPSTQRECTEITTTKEYKSLSKRRWALFNYSEPVFGTARSSRSLLFAFEVCFTFSDLLVPKAHLLPPRVFQLQSKYIHTFNSRPNYNR